MPYPIKNVTVYSGASSVLGKNYHDAAIAIGKGIAQHGWGLVYGGSTIGLMGLLAKTAKENGAHITAIYPDFAEWSHIRNELVDQEIKVKTMRERKKGLEDYGDAFIVLPGGFGTLDELLEILVLKMLLKHDKPVVLINTDGFYDGLIKVFERIYADKFAKPGFAIIYHVAKDSADAFRYLETYEPQPLPNVFFEKEEVSKVD